MWWTEQNLNDLCDLHHINDYLCNRIEPDSNMNGHYKPYENIYDAIGNTPLVRFKELSEYCNADVYGKLEYFNPGQSMKDRIVLELIQSAEARGALEPGATIVEATSGNTGFSLAMISAAKGYKCILTVKDTASEIKIKMMEALGAEVVLCPAGVPGDHPDSYYNTAKRIAEELPNGFYLNQNHNLGNSMAHYKTTGPELWQQTEGEITHLFASASTGGSISGTGLFLKEQNPDIQVIGVDSATNVLNHYKNTGEFKLDPQVKTKLEGVGKNIIPRNVNFNIIDQFVNVSDEESAYAAKRLAKNEGIFVGYSSGAAMAALMKSHVQIPRGSTVVLLCADGGARYMNKIFDPQWMKNQGFMNGITRLEQINNYS